MQLGYSNPSDGAKVAKLDGSTLSAAIGKLSTLVYSFPAYASSEFIDLELFVLWFGADRRSKAGCPCFDYRGILHREPSRFTFMFYCLVESMTRPVELSSAAELLSSNICIYGFILFVLLPLRHSRTWLAISVIRHKASDLAVMHRSGLTDSGSI